MFQYIEYIKAVHECKSFTKAAEKLYITQPALSIVIKKVEKNLGVSLFIRGKKEVTLTEEGKLYLQAAKKIAVIEQRVRDQFQNQDTELCGRLNIGAAGICMHYVIPTILKEFNQRFPKVRVEITEESFYHLQELLLRDELDLLLDSESYHSKILHERLFPNTLFYAIPSFLIHDSKLLEKSLTAEDIINNKYLKEEIPKISMQEVLDIPFLSLQPKNELYARAEILFNYYNCRPETVMHFNQQLTSYLFCQKGFGAAFVSDTLIRSQPVEHLRFFVFDYPLAERWISIGYKRDQYLTKTMSAFIQTAKSLYR